MKRTGVVLWSVQGLLAAVFLLAGVMKLVMPAAALAAVSPFPVPFMRFIAAMEVLGALGLVLPGLFHIHTELTPLAASGLVVIMTGATVATIATMGIAPAVLPAIVGVLAAWVAYARWRVAPLSSPPVA